MKQKLLFLLMTTLCCFICNHSALAEEPIKTYSYNCEIVVDEFVFRIYLPDDFEKTLKGYAYLVGRDKSKKATVRGKSPKKVCIDAILWQEYQERMWAEVIKKLNGFGNHKDNQANNSETRPTRDNTFSFGMSAGLARQKTDTTSTTYSTPSKQSYYENSNTATSVRRSYNIDPDAKCTFELKLIGNGAFKGMTDLTEIEIPNTVTTIWPNAFKDCTNLKKVTLPESVVFIGWGAFQGCTSLESITIPKSVANIGDVAFRNCTSLKNFTFPESVVSIGWGVFWGCKKLEYVTLPNNLHEIPTYLVEDCPALKTVNIPTSMTSINSEVFWGTSLQTITIPEGIKLIDSGAFAFCENLRSVIIPKSLKRLATGAFCGCTSLQDIELNEGLEIIEEGAFFDSGIRRLTIPSTVKEIPEYTFQQCEQLESIVLPEGLEKLGMMAFDCCTSLKTIKIPNSLKRLNEKTFEGCSNLTKVEFDSRSQLKYIGPGCFAMCSSLREFDMPDSVTEIDDDSDDGVYMFMDTPIERLKMSASLTSFPPLYLDETLKEISFGENSQLTTIGELAFLDYKLLKHFQFPDKLKTIERRAFEGCENLEELVFPEGLTTIGNNAFYNCNKVAKIEFPLSIKEIGYHAFRCEELKDVYVKWTSNPYEGDGLEFTRWDTEWVLHIPIGTMNMYKSIKPWKSFKKIVEIGKETSYITFADAAVKAICIANWDSNGDGELSESEASLVKYLTGFKGNESIISFDELKYFTSLTGTSDSFKGCTNLTSITLPNSVTIISSNAFEGCRSLTSITIPNSVVTIDVEAFYGCRSLTSITIPNSVTTIDIRAFGLCQSLTSIIIPNSVTDLRGSAFYGCRKLTSIKISNNIKSINASTFNGCSALTSITIPDGVVSIGSNAFSGCTSLSSINIPNNVLSIEATAFYGCSSLTSATIGKSVNSIGEYAFSGCNNLLEVTSLIENPFDINDNVFSSSTNSKLYVPVGTKSKYQAAKGWKKFKYILEEGSSPDDVTLTAKSYSRVYGNPNPTFEYTVTNGTITSGTPTITCSATATSPVGTYDIVIAKGTVSNSNVELVKGTLTITKAPLTISAGNYTKVEGEDNPTFKATYSGFKNNETESILTKKPTLTTTATKTSAAGEYPVTVSGAEAQNYNISYKNGTLKVLANTVTLTAKSYTREYGEANPTFDYTTSGGTIISGSPAITCSATATSPVGTYDIVIAKGTVSNSNVELVKGTLTITKAPLTISAGNYTKVEGEDNPTFTPTYSGFKNGETEAVLTKKPIVTCEANKDSEPGSYEIKVSGAKAQNYDISYVSGWLTIEENPNKFEEDDTSYEILDNGTVAITKDWKVQHTQVLPTIVLYDGKSYTVTVIGADAFRNNQNLTQITIPNTITSIGDGAFAGCVNLTVIIIHVENPIDIAKARTRAGGSSVFEGVDKETCILYVPDGSVEAYKTTDGWNEFKNILPISALGIDGVNMDGLSFDVYNLQGRKVRHEATSLDGLPKGVYIINGRKVVK